MTTFCPKNTIVSTTWTELETSRTRPLFYPPTHQFSHSYQEVNYFLIRMSIWYVLQNNCRVNSNETMSAKFVRSKGEYCGASLDSRDLHIRTCKMNPIHHQKHAAVQHWFQELAKQAHIATTPAPPISETTLQNPTKPLAADLLLIDAAETVRL